MSDFFRYTSGIPVRVGDVIRFAGKDAVVEMVILPDTQDATDYSCPDGGVMVITAAYGRVLSSPDEDWEFVRRGDVEKS